MKDHVETITDLLMGAAFADKRLEGDEVSKIRDLLCKLLGTTSIPDNLVQRMKGFNPAKFDATAAATRIKADLGDDAAQIIDMIAAVHEADEEFDMAEDAYVRKVGAGLGLSDEQLKAHTVEIEVDGSLT